MCVAQRLKLFIVMSKHGRWLRSEYLYNLRSAHTGCICNLHFHYSSMLDQCPRASESFESPPISPQKAVALGACGKSSLGFSAVQPQIGRQRFDASTRVTETSRLTFAALRQICFGNRLHVVSLRYDQAAARAAPRVFEICAGLAQYV
jgi:hypothetical protein